MTKMQRTWEISYASVFSLQSDQHPLTSPVHNIVKTGWGKKKRKTPKRVLRVILDLTYGDRKEMPKRDRKKGPRRHKLSKEVEMQIEEPLGDLSL